MAEGYAGPVMDTLEFIERAAREGASNIKMFFTDENGRCLTHEVPFTEGPIQVVQGGVAHHVWYRFGHEIAAAKIPLSSPVIVPDFCTIECWVPQLRDAGVAQR